MNHEEQSSATAYRQVKRRIRNCFGTAAKVYDTQAELRKEVANRLVASLKPWQAIIPPGPVIELGCGTGFLTEGLLELYPERTIQATDISEEMVARCRQKLSDAKNLDASVLDAEQLPADEQEYALVVSSFVAQWFEDPSLTMSRWFEAVKPGGLLLAAFPGGESFPEWKKHCRELGIPFTGNSLPDVEEMVIKMSVGPSQVDYYEDTATQTFESAYDFFAHLKEIGASTPKEGRALSPRELKMLVNHWDDSAGGAVTVSNHLVFLAVKKDY
ncbi:methyltransferase domain-containing protein [Fodinibius sediminis]|uniref:Malonyl-CoA O-methyltransferase n=1 Tax=Fodinibius sediminis TaxID=1214077 RepID=A0A521B236_9BACT|nr:methyltransferase domain-containing protein [Fodinibius sediminis]SMO41162.1 malonyl-CoA O-methyltransferase [Fodinibius sediminis]